MELLTSSSSSRMFCAAVRTAFVVVGAAAATDVRMSVSMCLLFISLRTDVYGDKIQSIHTIYHIKNFTFYEICTSERALKPQNSIVAHTRHINRRQYYFLHLFCFLLLNTKLFNWTMIRAFNVRAKFKLMWIYTLFVLIRWFVACFILNEKIEWKEYLCFYCFRIDSEITYNWMPISWNIELTDFYFFFVLARNIYR